MGNAVGSCAECITAENCRQGVGRTSKRSRKHGGSRLGSITLESKGMATPSTTDIGKCNGKNLFIRVVRVIRTALFNTMKANGEILCS